MYWYCMVIYIILLDRSGGRRKWLYWFCNMQILALLNHLDKFCTANKITLYGIPKKNLCIG